MSWLFYISLAAFFWGAHNVFIKFVSEDLPPALTASIFYFIALLTTATIYLFSSEKVELSQLQDWKVIVALLLAGVTIGLVDYLYVTGLSKGGSLTLSGPIFSTVGLVLIAAAGIVFF